MKKVYLKVTVQDYFTLSEIQTDRKSIEIYSKMEIAGKIEEIGITFVKQMGRYAYVSPTFHIGVLLYIYDHISLN